MNETKSGWGLALTALIVAILALILAWTAFNRSGADLEEVIEQQVQEAMREVEEEYQEAEREVRQETAENLEEAANDVSADGDSTTAGE